MFSDASIDTSVAAFSLSSKPPRLVGGGDLAREAGDADHAYRALGIALGGAEGRLRDVVQPHRQGHDDLTGP